MTIENHGRGGEEEEKINIDLLRLYGGYGVSGVAAEVLNKNSGCLAGALEFVSGGRFTVTINELPPRDLYPHEMVRQPNNKPKIRVKKVN